jgi:hypothetical protein
MNVCSELNFAGPTSGSVSGASGVLVVEESPVMDIDQTFSSRLGVQCIYQLNFVRTPVSGHSRIFAPGDGATVFKIARKVSRDAGVRELLAVHWS